MSTPRLARRVAAILFPALLPGVLLRFALLFGGTHLTFGHGGAPHSFARDHRAREQDFVLFANLIKRVLRV
jgi:hypothetical protein